MTATPQLDAEKEGLIVELRGEAVNLLELIATEFPRRGANYYLQSLFLVLRQMGYFFTEKSSPLKSQIGVLSAGELNLASSIRTIRDAIGHRELPTNFASPGLKLVGGMNFKNNDVEIQYGETRLMLLGDIASNHRRYRELFRSAPELSGLFQHPMWAIEDARLAAAETLLAQKLANPEELMAAMREGQ